VGHKALTNHVDNARLAEEYYSNDGSFSESDYFTKFKMIWFIEKNHVSIIISLLYFGHIELVTGILVLRIGIF